MIRRPMRSPYVRTAPQPKPTGVEAFFELPRLVEDLKKKRDEIDAGIAKLDTAIANAQKIQKGDTGPRGPQGFSVKGPKGDQGEKGEKGDTPSVEAIAEVVVPKLAAYIPNVKNGKDAQVNLDEILAYVIANLPEQKETEKEPEEKKEEPSSFDKRVETVLRRFGLPHGGGDTVAAGNNVTITDVGGTKIISASGGGGGVFYTPTGDVDASNTAFVVTAQPTSVIADGVTYFENAGYTYAALTVTMDVPPSQYIRYTL